MHKDILSDLGTPFLVYFAARSKYVLFFMEIAKDAVVLRTNPADRVEGEKELVWREMVEHDNFDDLHEYSAIMMRDLMSPAFNVLQRIGALFDLATASKTEGDIIAIDKISDVLDGMRLGHH